jgi:hypothetical protein
VSTLVFICVVVKRYMLRPFTGPSSGVCTHELCAQYEFILISLPEDGPLTGSKHIPFNNHVDDDWLAASQEQLRPMELD